MIKRRIKIVILFIIVVVLFIGGWYMYKRLDYNRQSFAENVYQYVSPKAIQVINVNREYNLDELFLYDNSLYELTNILGRKKPVPIVISKYEDGDIVLMTKVNLDQQNTIKEHIASQVALPFPVKKQQYKDTEVFVYCLPDGTFLACSFYSGIFVASKSYKQVCDIIDADIDNSFFANSEDEEMISRILERIPVSMYIKSEKGILALDYSVRSDTIKMNGYLYGSGQSDSLEIKQKFTPYIIDYPSDICVESYDITGSNPPAVEIILLTGV